MGDVVGQQEEGGAWHGGMRRRMRRMRKRMRLSLLPFCW